MHGSQLAYLFARAQTARFSSLETRSVFAPANSAVYSESAMAQAQLALKENGRWDSDWFIPRYAQNTPLLIKRIGTTLLDHAPDAPTVFPIVILAKVDSDTAYSAPAPFALDMRLDR